MSSSSNGQSSGQAPASLVHRIFQPRVLFILAFLGAIPIFLPPAIKELPKIDDDNGYRLQWSDVELVNRPAVLPEDFLAQVERTASQQAGGPAAYSLTDDQAARKIASAFALQPWVAKVDEVRLSYPAHAKIRLEFRQPVAVVEMANGVYPVAADGVLLPPKDFTSAMAARYPLIRNVVTKPAGLPGTSWGDPVVTGAARMAETLQPEWQKLNLAAIICPRPTKAKYALEDVEYRLVTTGGSLVDWGRAPGADAPGELTAAQKVGRLTQYVTSYGRFDDPSSAFEVDIRHWQEMTRRPLQTVLRTEPNGRVRR